MELPEKVVFMFEKMPRKDRNLAGGLLHRTDVVRQIANYENYKANGVFPNRSRVNLGYCEFLKPDRAREPIGYCSFTIIRNANPTEYERENIHLSGKLNYVQARNIFVDKDHRREGVAEKLFSEVRRVAGIFELPIVADIMKRNGGSIELSKIFGMAESFSWANPTPTEMVRFASKHKGYNLKQ